MNLEEILEIVWMVDTNDISQALGSNTASNEYFKYLTHTNMLLQFETFLNFLFKHALGGIFPLLTLPAYCFTLPFQRFLFSPLKCGLLTARVITHTWED